MRWQDKCRELGHENSGYGIDCQRPCFRACAFCLSFDDEHTSNPDECEDSGIDATFIDDGRVDYINARWPRYVKDEFVDENERWWREALDTFNELSWFAMKTFVACYAGGLYVFLMLEIIFELSNLYLLFGHQFFEAAILTTTTITLGKCYQVYKRSGGIFR